MARCDSDATRRSTGCSRSSTTTQALLDAAHKVARRGTKIDAFSPFPIHGLAEALAFASTRCRRSCWRRARRSPGRLRPGMRLDTGIAYPLNIGGRPFHSWVSFIPPAFETTILFAAFAAVIGMLALNGLPQPYHPVFNAPRFHLASQDKFFLVIEASDPKFDAERRVRS